MSEQQQSNWPPQPAGPGQPSQPPQQPYGVPPQPGAYPPPPQGAGQAGYGYPGEPVKGKNGFATVSLIFGIIGGIPLGIGFGIAGLVRAAKVNNGKVRSWIGIILSVLWLAVSVVIGVNVGTHVAKALDPGCVAAKDSLLSPLSDKIAADTDADTYVKDVEAMSNDLNAAAAKAKDATARDSIKKLAGDYQQAADLVKNGKQPTAMASQLTSDGAAVDTACGTIGS